MTADEALKLAIANPSQGLIAKDARYSNHKLTVYPFELFWTVFANGAIRLNHVTRWSARVGSMPRVHHQSGYKIGTGIVYWNPAWQELDDADTFDVTHVTSASSAYVGCRARVAGRSHALRAS